jgi:hypothetical protein
VVRFPLCATSESNDILLTSKWWEGKDAKDKKSIFVPLKSDRAGSRFTDMLHYVVYFEVLYSIVETADRKRGVRGVKYSLVEPDPWLIALAGIMWEGLVQGLTWDTIKALSLAALGKLREKGIAPNLSSISKAKLRRRGSRTEIGFSWTEYSTSGRPLHQFFLGVKRRFTKSSAEERATLTKASRIQRKARITRS